MSGSKSARLFLLEIANTNAVDINEILLGYYMGEENWNIYREDLRVVQAQIKKKKRLITPEQFYVQDERAKVMAKESLRWLKKAGFKLPIRRVWWTARPNAIKDATGQDVDSRKNPSDILVQTADGKFVGISAKSTKGKGDIGFKNPGMGTIETVLGIELGQYEQAAIDQAMSEFPEMPKSKKARKKWIREREEVQQRTQELGSKMLEQMRDALYQRLRGMSDDDLKDHLLDEWIDAKNMFPPYIKVTGHGKKEPFTAKVENPLKNSKVAHINQGPIEVEKAGSTAVGIKAAGKRIMKIRFKTESEKLASSVKLSGDPW